jgi:preprotein translocase subunit SecY
MPYCPNPECPFRKRHGESAEYNQGTAACSDCDTALVAEDLLGKAVKQKKEFRMRDIHKRLLWTLALLVFWNFVRHFPLPGLDGEGLMRWGALAGNLGLRVSLFSLGLMPYITACVAVEVAALLVPPLKQWRTRDGESGRARLRRAALFLTVVIGIIHGRALVWQMGTMAGGQFLVDNGTAFKSLLVLTLVAAMFFIIWIADQISTRGCGHGISLIILSGIVGGIPHDFLNALQLYKKALSSPQFIMPLVAIAGAIDLIVYVERSTRQVPIQYADGTQAAFPIKLTTAGKTPVSLAHSLLALPLFFVPVNESFNEATRPVLTWIVENLHQGTVVYTAASAVLIIILYFVFTALFFNPREMIDYLKERNASVVPDETDAKRDIYRGLEGMAFIGSLYLVLVPLSFKVIWWLLGTEVTRVNGISLIVAVCITLDLTGELLFRWRSDSLVRIAEFHEPWKAGLLRSLLEKEKVPCIVRGYYHRSLLYLFGPYIEMPVLVAGSNENAARDVMRRYFNQD